MKVTVEMTENELLEYLDFKREKDYIIKNIAVIRGNYAFKLEKHGGTELKKLAKNIFEDIEKLLFEHFENK